MNDKVSRSNWMKSAKAPAAANEAVAEAVAA
jgi:hypothetical protein